MSYGNRSKQFDWFKNSNQIKKPKKESAKTIWKFLKIFIYISLFVFSMVGCIQSFVIKTTNFSGQGFEIYDSEQHISPHVTEIQFTKVDPKTFKGDGSVGEVQTLYKVKTELNSNIYINHSEKDDNGSIIEQIQTTIRNQNGKNNLKMSDAWKGINESFRFESDIENLKSKEKVHKFENSAKYSVLSSKSIGENYNLGGDTKLSDNNKLWIPTLDDKGKPTNKYEQALIKLYVLNDEFKPTSVVDNPDTYNVDKPRNLFRIAQLNTIFNLNNAFYRDFINIDPTTIVGTTKEQQNFNNIQRIAYGEILKYLGIQDAIEKDNSEKVFKMLDNYMPGSETFGDTSYRPIVDWNSAWSLGPFYGFFVYPIGKVFTLMLGSMPLMQGWEVLLAIIILVIISRLLTFLLSFKSTLQQTKMQELQAKKAIIDAKYAPYKGNKQMENRKRQETADLYKKEGINPLGAIGTAFVTMPIFLTLLRVISGVQQVKSTIWLGINFSATSYQELFQGSLQYLPLLILAAGIQLFAQIYPRLITRKRDKHKINVYQKAAMKKNNKTQNIMMGVIVFMSLIFSAGMQIYWIIAGIWRVFEVYITHKIIHRHKKSRKEKKSNYQFVTSN